MREKGVRIQFLGAGDAFGSGGRLQTCVLVETSGAPHLLIDCGASSLTAMARWDVDPSDVGWVVVSHLHGDHYAGLPYLILHGQFNRRKRRLVIAGPPSTRARVEATMEVLFPGSLGVSRGFAIEYVELVERERTVVGHSVVTPYVVDHASGAPSYGLRLEVAERVIASSGDTAWSEVLVELAAEADLFISEAYSFDKKIRYHLDYATLRANSDRITARRTVLTHMGHDMLAHQADAEYECAEDGTVFTV